MTDSLEFAAFDIETTGFTVTDTVTVVRFAVRMGVRASSRTRYPTRSSAWISTSWPPNEIVTNRHHAPADRYEADNPMDQIQRQISPFTLVPSS